jgi:acyl carrier protein
MTLQEVLKDAFNMKDAEYNDTQSLMQLEDWDSMSHMVFITQLEEAFGIELSGDEIVSLETIGDVKKILESKGKIVTV